jgi:chaperonin GroES
MKSRSVLRREAAQKGLPAPQFDKPASFTTPLSNRSLYCLYDVIWVRPDKPADLYKGIIIIPETARRRLWQGTIVNIGSGLRPGYDHKHIIHGGEYDGMECRENRWSGKLTPMDVQVGDRVLVEREQAEIIRIDGEDLWVMRYAMLVAVLGDERVQGAEDWLEDQALVENCDLPSEVRI